MWFYLDFLSGKKKKNKIHLMKEVIVMSGSVS